MATGVKGVTGGGLEADSYQRKGVEGDSSYEGPNPNPWYLTRRLISGAYRAPQAMIQSAACLEDAPKRYNFQMPVRSPKKNLTRQNKKHLKNDGTWKWSCCCWFPSTRSSKKPNHSCLLSDVFPGAWMSGPRDPCKPRLANFAIRGRSVGRDWI